MIVIVIVMLMIMMRKITIIKVYRLQRESFIKKKLSKILLWANARNVSFSIPLRWPIYTNYQQVHSDKPMSGADLPYQLMIS